MARWGRRGGSGGTRRGGGMARRWTARRGDGAEGNNLEFKGHATPSRKSVRFEPHGHHLLLLLLEERFVRPGEPGLSSAGGRVSGSVCPKCETSYGHAVLHQLLLRELVANRLVPFECLFALPRSSGCRPCGPSGCSGTVRAHGELTDSVT